MKKLSLALLAACTFALTACPAEPPPPPPPPPVETPPPPPPPPPAAVIPDYAPVGDGADIKKAAAAGIDDKNALAKATETEAALDKAITDLEAKKK